MLRIGLIFAFIAAAIILAYQVGSRLSNEAVMTIVGVTCGIAASIPVSVGLLIALTRDRSEYVAEDYIEPAPAPEPYNIYRPQPAQPQYPNAGQQPQIIVVAPPQQQMPPNYSPYGNYLMPGTSPLPAPMQERTFKIVGEDDSDD